MTAGMRLGLNAAQVVSCITWAGVGLQKPQSDPTAYAGRVVVVVAAEAGTKHGFFRDDLEACDVLCKRGQR